MDETVAVPPEKVEVVANEANAPENIAVDARENVVHATELVVKQKGGEPLVAV